MDPFFTFIGMSELLFPTFDMTEPEVQMITEIYQQGKGKYNAEFDFDISFDLASFEAFRYYDINHSGPVIAFNVGSNPFYLSFIKVGYSYPQGRYSSGSFQDRQIWGIAHLKRSYGHILIRTETFLDKVREMLCHVELNFEEDAAFSDKYYVLANEETKARSAMGPAFRDQIKALDIKDVVIEIIDSTLIIGNDKIMTPDTAEKMVDFLDKMTSRGPY